MAYEAGAFPGSPVGAGAMTIIGAYNIPNFVIDAYDVVVNRPKTAAYRAPGATNAALASETIIDELAEKCGIDPLDFRLHERGQRRVRAQTAGPPFKRIGFSKRSRRSRTARTTSRSSKAESRPRRGGGLLVQRRSAVLGDGQHPHRRHRQRHHRLGRYRRVARRAWR